MSAVKNHPATPLPWYSTDGETNFHKNRHFVKHKEVGGDRVLVSGLSGKGSFANAAYIVHAANAYPKLVEALRELTGRIADAEQWNPAMKPEQFRLALGTVQGATQFTAATALLRELGEAS